MFRHAYTHMHRHVYRHVSRYLHYSYIHVYTHVYMHVYIHVYIHVYRHVYGHRNRHTCLRRATILGSTHDGFSPENGVAFPRPSCHSHLSVHPCVHACACAYLHECIRASVCVCMCTYMRASRVFDSVALRCIALWLRFFFELRSVKTRRRSHPSIRNRSHIHGHL